jgi:hypothetical protein
MDNNLNDRETKRINILDFLNYDLEDILNNKKIKSVKELGKGVEGVVYLLKLAEKYEAVLKINNVFQINKINVLKLKKSELLKTDGFVEYYASLLINILLEDKISPNFVYNYKAFITKNQILSYNEFIKSDSLRNFLKKNKNIDKKVIFNIFFQILSALHALQYHFNMIHADLHFENILISEIKPGGYWEYIINGKKYYIPNLGYQIYLNDYGYAIITNKNSKGTKTETVMGKDWYVNIFKNISESNKYNLYDLLLIRFEFFKYLGPHFNLFFRKYFDYQDLDDYAEDPKIPYFPQDLNILDIIELLFSKNDISNCKDLEWYCFDEMSGKLKDEKLIETYNMDEKIDKKIINNILNSTVKIIK